MYEKKNEVRIDKWLWAVRIYKTRSMATDACRKGKVRIHDHEIKPGKTVHVNDMVTVYKDNVHYTYRVKQLISKRTSAKLADYYRENLTPAAELEKKKIIRTSRYIFRPKGSGRPTKKERRMMNRFTNNEE